MMNGRFTIKETSRGDNNTDFKYPHNIYKTAKNVIPFNLLTCTKMCQQSTCSVQTVNPLNCVLLVIIILLLFRQNKNIEYSDLIIKMLIHHTVIKYTRNEFLTFLTGFFFFIT